MKISKTISILSIFLSVHCIVDRPAPLAGTFLEENIQMQKALRRSLQISPDSNLHPVLMGNLNPRHEPHLHKIAENHLVLSVSGTKSPGGWNFQRTNHSNPRSDFQSKTQYRKLAWNNEEIYSVHRKQTLRLGDWKPSLIFQGISRLITDDPVFTKTQAQLCRSFQCRTLENRNRLTLQYSFHTNTEQHYPSFYEKYAARFDKLSFRTTLIPDGNASAQIEIDNNRRTIDFFFPTRNKTNATAWASPRSIRIETNFTIRSYGITIRVNQLVYTITYHRSGDKETIRGYFVGVPRAEIQGRFFYIIPQGVVDAFIPGNVESYLRNGLTLMTVGSTGDKGSRFEWEFSGNGKNAMNRFTSQSEIYRNKFSLFESKKDSEEYNRDGSIQAFFDDLVHSIALDLSHPQISLPNR